MKVGRHEGKKVGRSFGLGPLTACVTRAEFVPIATKRDSPFNTCNRNLLASLGALNPIHLPQSAAFVDLRKATPRKIFSFPS
jgi:hypothetical protein